MQIYIVYKETWLIDGPEYMIGRPFLDESIAGHHFFIAEKRKNWKRTAGFWKRTGQS